MLDVFQRGSMGTEPNPALDATRFRDELKSQIETLYKTHDKGTKAWSTAYNGCLILSAILSAIATMVVKLSFLKMYSTDVVAICSGLATLCTALVAAGGFSRKWRANRTARSRLSQLLIDVNNPTSDLEAIRTSLKKIIQDEDDGIMGTT